MRKKTLIPKKKKGPAPTGVGKPQVVRMQDQQIAIIDAWIAMQEDEPSRPEAIRRLVELGLKAAPALRENVLSTGPTARDLAAAQIDRMVDADASADEQAVRKRRLLKGPPEFRDSRVDVEQRQWGVVGKKKTPGPANSK